MTKRRFQGESGMVLLPVLGFLMFVGVLGVALLGQADTNIRVSVRLEPLRAAQFAADGAVEGAINKLRLFRPDASAPCLNDFFAVDPPLNGKDVVVSCSNPVATTSGSDPVLTVTFTARCAAPGSEACPTDPPLIVARVRFQGTPPVVSTRVENWSVAR